MSASAPVRVVAPSVIPSRDNSDGVTVVAEFPLSPFESFAATLRRGADGRQIAAISRIKYGADGVRRCGCLEWGAHRTHAVASLLDELLRAIADRSSR